MPATQRKGSDDKERVRVFVRMRPMRQFEGESTVRTDDEGRRLWLAGERLNGSVDPTTPLQFDFDGILPSDIAQTAVYEAVARPLVDAATSGHAACLMCYGQTGTGKTYTFGGGELLKSAAKPSRAAAAAEQQPDTPSGKVGGRRSAASAPLIAGPEAAAEAKRAAAREAEAYKRAASEQKARAGVIGRALRHVLEWAQPRGMRVCIAYVQVYMELLQDLLRPESALVLREHPDLGVYVDGAQWREVATADSACSQVAEADARRTTAFTKLNADSSRSHAVLMIAIRNPADAETVRPPPTPGLTARGGSSVALSADAEWASARGRLFLVDLAGSERTKRSGAIGQNFDEACSINQSLTTLGRCIQALASAKTSRKGGGGSMPAPVRESKLTRLLSPCLGGAMTSLVCCVSAAAADRYETLSTLEFGRNAMKVMLRPQSQMGVDYKSLTIQLQAQLDEKSMERHAIEAEVYAKVRCEYDGRLVELERARRSAEVAKQEAELAFERRAGAEQAATAKAKEATATLMELQAQHDSAAKTSRASHDSRAAIIATADSLAEEVVRARRDRDEALHQLELLTSQLSGGAMMLSAGGGGGEAAGGPGGPAEAKLPEGASAIERECAGAIAELSAYRPQLERRKMRARAAAARGGLGTHGVRSAADRAVADRRSLHAMRTTISSTIGGFSELLATCVELAETQHPDLWQGTPEQLTLTEQIRTAQRLVHMLGRVHQDFGSTPDLR